MARIAILLPRDDMLLPAQQIAEQYHLDILEIAAVHTSNVLEKAQEVIQNGADIIIARGIQAMLIKHNTTISVVEIQLTGQEMVALLNKAKNLVTAHCPAIWLVGFRNMFCDLSSFDALLDVRLTPYFVTQSAQMDEVTQQAILGGADVIIGGDTVCSCAAAHSLPSVFIASGPESIAEACRVTQHIAYAMDQEKRNAAEFKAILDYTVNGLLQVDVNGILHHLNHSAEQMLGNDAQQMLGQPIWSFIPALDAKQLSPVLHQGQEVYSVRIKLGRALFLASVSPVQVDEKVTGAIISITEGKQLELYAAEQRKELFRQGYTTPFSFDTIIARSIQAQATMAQAKCFAPFNMPVLITGEYGTEKEELAQCIHNASAYAENALVSINCGGLSPEAVEKRLFGTNGEHGLVEKAQGILFLSEVSRLSLSAQYQLYCLIAHYRNSSYCSVDSHTVPLRVLASDSRDLAPLVQEGSFREDLYYALSVMTLSLSPLRQRRDDILGWAEFFFRELQQQHARYLHLTNGAWQLLHDYDWPGNLAQLYNLCQRIIVEAPRHTVDELFLDKLLHTSAPIMRANTSAPTVVYCDPRAARIVELLKSCNGCRTAVARELGVSTTTLWRYMKKYGLTNQAVSIKQK